MRILLTGCAGFLGSHLGTRLLDDGHQVIGLDDMSTGSLRNIEYLLKNPNFSFIKHDIRNPIDVKVDGILNFACPASPIHYQTDPVRTIETNFLGMINVLHLAKKYGARVLQASTSEVYGDPQVTPQSELYWGNVNPIGIRSCYDEGKRAAETLSFDYLRQYQVDVRVVRIFNTYGPNMAIGDGRVVSNFIIQALRGENLTIYGDGSHTRSFCYVEDLVEGILRLFYLDSNPMAPINLGNPQEFTILELATLVRRMVNTSLDLVFNPLPGDDPKQRRPDITRAQELLKWQPTIDITTGIESTTEYFKKVLKES
jgi:UDP-glucuronate decarboxylase